MPDDDQLDRARLERELAAAEAELVAAGLADRPCFDRAVGEAAGGPGGAGAAGLLAAARAGRGGAVISAALVERARGELDRIERTMLDDPALIEILRPARAVAQAMLLDAELQLAIAQREQAPRPTRDQLWREWDERVRFLSRRSLSPSMRRCIIRRFGPDEPGGRAAAAGREEGSMASSAESRLDGTTLVVRIPMRFQRRGGRKRIVAPDGSELAQLEAAVRRYAGQGAGQGAAMAADAR